MSTPETPPVTQVDTTDDGQGGTGPGNLPPAVTPSATDHDAGSDTTDTIPDSGVGRTGDTDAGAHDPETTPPDTSGTGGPSRTYRTGDTDDHTKDPSTIPPDTTGTGGGQAYRAPLEAPPVTNYDTSGRGGFLAVNPGSPDDQAVGNDSGLNPNAVEPSSTDEAYEYAGTRDTTNAGAPAFVTVPAAGPTPAAPTSVAASQIANRTAVHVTWVAPVNAVAAGVLGYVIENSRTGTMRVGKDVLTVEFEQGLIPGDTYTFTVYAMTANGSGIRSAPSAPITIAKTQNLVADEERDYGLAGPEHDVPNAPAAPVATVASATSVSVAFVPPTDDNGSPVTEYTVTSTPGNISAVGTSSPIVVTGLTTATPYTFKVKARNVYGYGAESAASNSVTPA